LRKIVKYFEQDYSVNKIDKKVMRKIFSFANKVGAIVTTVNGGIPSLPTSVEVKKYDF